MAPANVVWWTAATTLACALLFHFTMIICNILPTSPLKLQYGQFASRYVTPYFTQNWMFFAPTPVNRTIALIARGRYLDPATGSTIETSWADVSSPLVAEVRHSRFSALALLQLGLSNTVQQYVNALGSDDRSAKLDPAKQQRFIQSPVPSEVDAADETTLSRIAMASLKVQYPARNFSSIQLGVLIREFPRFSQRQEPDSASKNSVLLHEWQPAMQVPAFCCTAAGSPPAALNTGGSR